MKIYTKTGDEGTTALLGGRRVSKAHLRIDAYGTIDELNAQIGMVCDLRENHPRERELRAIQNNLFTVGAMLAKDPEKKSIKIPVLNKKDVALLEKAIDEMDVVLPPLTSFLLPGGHMAISQCHIARCVCRRAERIVILLKENDQVEDIVIQFLNRLSDYLFMLSRITAHELKVQEIPWISNKP